MHQHFTNKQLRLLIRAAIILLFFYLLILLGYIFLQKDFKRNASTIIKNTMSSAVSTVFTSNSSTLSYIEGESKDSNKKQVFLQTLYSPAMQYVQASTSKATAYEGNDSKIVIHTEIASPAPLSTTEHAPPETSTVQDLDTNETLDTYDNVYFEDEYDASTALAPAELTGTEKQVLSTNQTAIANLTASHDLNYLIKTFYKVNPSCVIDSSVWNVKKMLTKDLRIQKDSSKPQILIFHTHAHETFSDSRSGERNDSIVGVGDELTRVLKETYGYNVLHYSKQYNYNTAYNDALIDLNRLLKENPTIQIVIDLHRDGVSDSCNTHTVVNAGSHQMAPLMFFNGVSNNKKRSLNFHTNKNLQANLAFSLQMKLYAMQTYPQLTKKNFLKSFRYNMHVVERYSLVEVGDNNNTVAEAKAAMTPLAEILNHVLTAKNAY